MLCFVLINSVLCLNEIYSILHSWYSALGAFIVRFVAEREREREREREKERERERERENKARPKRKVTGFFLSLLSYF